MAPKKKGGKKKDDNYWDDEFEQDAQVLSIATESTPVEDAVNNEAPVNNDDDEPDFMAQIAKAANKKSKKKEAAPVEAADEQNNDDGTPRIKTKKEKEREKKERQKEQKKLQAANKSAQPDASTAEKSEREAVVATDPVTPTTPKGDEEEDAEPTGGNKKKKKGKKTAEKEEPPKGKRKGPPVAALKQMLEAQRAAEEAAQKELEELERQEAERIKKLEEEDRRKEEIKQRKKEKEKAKREQLRKEGKLLTKSQKEAQQHAEIRKQQLLESGAVKIEALEDKENKPKKVVYGSKKKKGGKDKNAQEVKPNKAEEEEKRPEEEEAKKAVQVEEVKESWENSEDEVNVEGVKDSWDMSSDEEEEAPATMEEAEDEKADDDEDEDEEEDGDSSDSDDSDEDDSSDDEEEETATGRENARRKEEAKRRREERHATALAARSADDLRSPICVILGHVDTGKTKLLDKIRQTNVQEGEAGGITQQIGATYFPVETIKQKCEGLTKDKAFDFKVPGLLVIDTPGHESFTNLRSRGSSLCNIAVLVVDIMHGLEPQTIESIKLLRDRKTPFIVALNKIDRIYGWEPTPNGPFLESLAKQPRHVKVEFEDRVKKTNVAFAEQGLNSILYYENKNFARNVSLVPTSAITGEGIPDLLMLLIDLTQSRMSDKLMYISELECTVLEVKVIEGLGTTIDVILNNGVINEGDRIVVCGLNGPIVTNIRALLTPQPLKEMRVKSAYVHHKSIKAAQGIKICAPDLEKAVAGSRLLVVGPDDDEDEMKDDIMGDLQDLMSSVDKSGQGVCVQSSTLGSLEALLEFLKCSEIPVSGISIGPVHKRDVIRASTMLEKSKEFAVMLCFDVKIDREAQDLADELGIKIFKADIIYHLFDAFTAYKKDLDEQKRKDSAPQAVFPCVCRMIPGAIFNKKDPIVIGLDVIEGALRVGTPLAVLKMNPITQQKEVVTLGKVSSMEMNHKNVDVVKKGQAGGGVAVKIEGASYESSRVYGRHFDDKDMLYSRITRQSIDVLKENFRNDMSKEDWAVIIQLKKVLGI